MDATYRILYMDKSGRSISPLPTPNDTDGPTDELQSGTGCRVIKKDIFIIKFGVRVHPAEAFNMLYVAQSTTIPVPKIYAIYQREVGDDIYKIDKADLYNEDSQVVTYIVMQYIPGPTLLSLWGSLSRTRKMAIASTLRTYFDQLRKLPPPDYFGSIHRGPLLDELFSATVEGNTIKTPCATEDEVINNILQIYSKESGIWMKHKARYYQQVLPTVLRGSGSPVFTHCDFQRRNVLVQPDGIPVLIDWACASWCPTYWEYAAATISNYFWRDDWPEYVHTILDEYPSQSLWLSSIKYEIWE